MYLKNEITNENIDLTNSVDHENEANVRWQV